MGNKSFRTENKRVLLWQIREFSYGKKETRGVVGHPVGTKFLSLYIMYI
jgi:hypothetical protein